MSAMGRTGWVPVTDAKTARRCWGVIEDVERALSESPPDPDPLFSSGSSGLAVFFAYLDAARPGSDAGDRALDELGRSIDGLGEASLLPALYNGFSGIGWSVEHLTREFFEADEDLTAAIDEALKGLLSVPGLKLNHELIGGLAGFGTYLLERLPHPAAEGLLARVLDRLEETAEESEAGITWHTAPEWIPGWQRDSLSEGCYNLGVAHGVPGVLGFLAEAQRQGVRDSRVQRLAGGIARWLLGQRLQDDGSRFPAIAVPGKKADPTRSAWCYGDPGIAAVLLSAARAFGRPDWEEEAVSMMRLVARRPLRDIAADDAGLCHGAAGLAHLFNRFHQATGDPGFREASLDWYRRTLDMQRPGEGLAGYQSFLASGRGGDGSWIPQSGFLVGIAGIGLALLAAVSEVEPSWDRVLLTAIPPSKETP
ncbi:MAG TPA: lanthionine synthetase C family protein [Thermoanaerobaculia bacterium]|nr:lanthionine synthetase C family protein [Thermoanaerobaculia bacterium]